MHFWPVAIFVFVQLELQSAPTLDSLEAELKSYSPNHGFFADVFPVRKVNDGVLKLVAGDKLRTANDFQRASRLFTVLNWDFEDAREKYELTLTAFALGDTDAEKSLVLDWDTLQICCGRRQRLGSIKMPAEFASDKFALDPTAKCITATITDPTKARRSAKGLKDNPVLQSTVDADQRDREGDFTKKTEADFMAMMKHDRERLVLIKKTVAKGGARTAQDFFNAALVMQHGEIAVEYALAHELCLCSILLGDQKNARWLAAASYDRMLRHAGQRQRFATQYDAEGLQRTDTVGINDTMRNALHCPSFEDAKKRVFK